MTPYIVRPNHSYFQRSHVEQRHGESHSWLITETIETSPDGQQNVVSTTAQVRQVGIQSKGAKRVRQPGGQVATMIPKPYPVVRPDAFIKDVPFVSQLSAAKRCSSNYLCQYACAAMLAGKYWNKVYASVETVEYLVTHAKGAVCTTALTNVFETKAALESLQTSGTVTAGWLKYESVKDLLHFGVAVSVSLRYGELGEFRKDKGWKGGHQVVLIGVSEKRGSWTYLDPLNSKYEPIEVMSAQFRKSVNELTGSGGQVRGLYVV